MALGRDRDRAPSVLQRLDRMVARNTAAERTPMAGADHEQVVVPLGRQLVQSMGDGGIVYDEELGIDVGRGSRAAQHLVRVEMSVGAVRPLDGIDVGERYPRTETGELLRKRDRIASTLVTVHSDEHVLEHCIPSNFRYAAPAALSLDDHGHATVAVVSCWSGPAASDDFRAPRVRTRSGQRAVPARCCAVLPWTNRPNGP